MNDNVNEASLPADRNWWLKHKVGAASWGSRSLPLRVIVCEKEIAENATQSFREGEYPSFVLELELELPEPLTENLDALIDALQDGKFLPMFIQKISKKYDGAFPKALRFVKPIASNWSSDYNFTKDSKGLTFWVGFRLPKKTADVWNDSLGKQLAVALNKTLPGLISQSLDNKKVAADLFSAAYKIRP